MTKCTSLASVNNWEVYIVTRCILWLHVHCGHVYIFIKSTSQTDVHGLVYSITTCTVGVHCVHCVYCTLYTVHYFQVSQTYILATASSVVFWDDTSCQKLNRFSLSSDTSLPYVTTTLTLPTVKVEHVPLYVDLDMPAYATMREGFPVTYNIYNRTPYSQELELTLDVSDVFMFAGHKKVSRTCLGRPHCKVEHV